MAKLIHIYGVIGADVPALDVVGELDEASGPVTLAIHSPGGYVDDALAIVAAIDRHGEVTARIDGVAASCASLIACACARVEAAPGAEIMIHAPWQVTQGTTQAHEDAIAGLQRAEATMRRVYARRLSADQLDELLTGGDHWLTTEEALDLGLVDEIVDELATRDVSAALDHYRAVALTLRLPLLTTERSKMATKKKASPRRGEEIAPDAIDEAVEEAVENEILISDATLTGRDEAGDDVVITDVTIVADPIEVADAIEDAEAEEAGESLVEARRIAALRALGQRHGIDVSRHIESGARPDAVRAAIQRQRASAQRITIPDRRGTTIQPVHRAILDKLAGKPGDSALASRSLLDLVRMASGDAFADPASLFRAFCATKPGKRLGSADVAIGHTTEDFADLLDTGIAKIFFDNFNDLAIRTGYERWSLRRTGRIGVNQITSAGRFSRLRKVGEAAQIQQLERRPGPTALVDLGKYAGMFAVSEEAIWGGLSALIDIPAGEARAARETAVFRALDMLQYGGGTPGSPVAYASEQNDALSDATLAIAEAALDGQAKYLVVPPGLERLALSLVGERYGNFESDPLKYPGLEVIVEEGLTIDDDRQIPGAADTQWYLIADPQTRPTIAMVYLEGLETPMLDVQDGWRVLGKEYRVVYAFEAALLRKLDSTGSPQPITTIARGGNAP